MAREVDGGQLGIGDFDAFGVFVLVQLGAHLEAGIGCRRGDQLDDRAIAAQRLAPPVDGDERKQTMLDLVPLAGTRRQVAIYNGQLELVGQLLRQEQAALCFCDGQSRTIRLCRTVGKLEGP